MSNAYGEHYVQHACTTRPITYPQHHARPFIQVMSLSTIAKSNAANVNTLAVPKY